MKLIHNERKIMGFSQQHLPYLSYLCKCIFFPLEFVHILIYMYIYTLVMSRDTGRAQVNLQINIRRDYRYNLIASNEQVFRVLLKR